MEYGILTQDDNFIYLAPKKLTESIGIDEIMVRLCDAISWIRKNPERKLIITMPLDPTGRIDIEKNLGEFNDQCIALDPPILYEGCHSIFRHTQDLKMGILRQIQDLINSEDTVSA